jgi:hypothetical protein
LRVSIASISCCILVLFESASAGELYSFRSVNFPNRFIRHRDFMGYVEPIANSGSLVLKDATFKVQPGLADPRCVSFESFNYPGYYLRHKNYRVTLSLFEPTSLFGGDATFCPVTNPSLSGGGISFRAYGNLSAYYIRHKNFQLWIDITDGSDLFRRDATFIQTPPACDTRFEDCIGYAPSPPHNPIHITK